MGYLVENGPKLINFWIDWADTLRCSGNRQQELVRFLVVAAMLSCLGVMAVRSWCNCHLLSILFIDSLCLMVQANETIITTHTNFFC